MIIALPIISIVCCFAFIFYIIFRYGVPVSLSETYYILPIKWDWLFAAWTVLTSIPFGIYWFNVAPDKLKWIPVVVAISMCMIGVADCYKSGPKLDYRNNPLKTPIIFKGSPTESIKIHSSFKDWIKDIIEKFKPSNFFKYGPARFLHYTNSLLAIILATVYICLTAGTSAVVSTIIEYIVFTIIGLKVDGVYNKDYSIDLNNSAVIFFWEIICLTNLFVFIQW